MTVTTTYTPATYTGDGSTVAFTLNHTVLEESHVVVSLNGAVQGSGYTVSGVGGSGITVTFSSAPANGASITIERIVPYTQNTDLENFDGNPADVTEKQFDLLAMADQQIAEEQGRNIVLPIGASVTTNEVSGTITDSAKILTINSGGPALSEISQFGNLDVIASSPQNGDLLVYNGTNWTNLKSNLSASTPPTVNDDSGDGYSVSSRWYDTTADEAYVCLDATVGAAVWINTTLESSDLGSTAVADLIDDDTFATATSSNVPSAESTKAYVDNRVAAANWAYAILEDDLATNPSGNLSLTSIPASINEIEIFINYCGVSTAAADLTMTLTDSAEVTSGYNAGVVGGTDGNAIGDASEGGAFLLYDSSFNFASGKFYGEVKLNRVKSGANIWQIGGIVKQDNEAGRRGMNFPTGQIALGSDLTQLNIKTSTGTYNTGRITARYK